MSPKGKMGKNADLKKHFEGILGRDLEIDIDGEVVVRERVGTYTHHLEGRATSRDIGTTGASTKACGQTRILDVSGVARTGTDGKVEFLLSDFHCADVGRVSIEHPVNFLATPRSLSPVFLTAIRTVTGNGRDVKITVSSWDPTGTPAGNTPFDWRCRVPYLPVVD